MKMAVTGDPRPQTSVLSTPHPVSLPCSTVSVPKSFLSGTGRSSRRSCTLILSCQRRKRDDLVRPSEKKGSELFLNSVSPFPVVMFLATLPGSEALTSALGPAISLVRSLDLPDWLVHWGHPGNMAVVLFALGGYGTYLGFRIRFSDDEGEIAKAKDLHPKLLGGMFFFFSLGALGGITSLLTSEKPILDSPHAVTNWIDSPHYSSYFTITFPGKSWIEECARDLGQRYHGHISCSCCAWTPAWSQFLN